MARITTKEYVAAGQMKKNGDCISGNKPGSAVSDCVTGEASDDSAYPCFRFRCYHVLRGVYYIRTSHLA